MNVRRRARELALQALFQHDVQGEPFGQELDDFLKENSEQLDIRHFARQLTTGTWTHRAEADEILNRLTVRWSVDRMAIADRNILRMGIYQLLHCKDIPARVVINEAIELGKRYSTAESPQFINGLLDAANRQVNANAPADESASAESETENPELEEVDEPEDDLDSEQ